MLPKIILPSKTNLNFPLFLPLVNPSGCLAFFPFFLLFFLSAYCSDTVAMTDLSQKTLKLRHFVKHKKATSLQNEQPDDFSQRSDLQPQLPTTISSQRNNGCFTSFRSFLTQVLIYQEEAEEEEEKLDKIVRIFCRWLGLHVCCDSYLFRVVPPTSFGEIIRLSDYQQVQPDP